LPTTRRLRGRLEAGEVELQRIALVQAKARVGAELALQDGDQVEVQLDHVELRAAAEQALGQRALARADLQQALVLLGADGAQDAVDDAGIVQEVLAEALARAVLVFGHGRAAPGFKLQASSKSAKRKNEVG